MKKLLSKIWWLVAFALTAFAYGFATRKSNKEMKEAIDKVDSQAKKEKQKVDEVKENIKDRGKKDKELSKKLNKHFDIFIILILSLSILTIPVLAETPDINNLKIPDSYDKLVPKYRDMALIAIEYQQLYREAEADNKELIKSNENMQQLIKTQQEIIDKLLKKDGSIGVFTGINYTPVKPLNSGVIIGVNKQF